MTEYTDYRGNTIKYGYNELGNMTYGPVNGVMGELVYDCRNRLVSAGGITYTYNAENIRIKAETADYVEEYVTDTVSASLSRVLTMTVYRKQSGVAQATGTTTTYYHGQGLISEETGDSYLYHHYNNLGSTMKLTDAYGKVVASYTYGVYGELLSGDTTLTRYLYNGRCGVSTDENGLYYMRQRYYNPEIKRFVNQDILTGSLTNSQSLNRYSYVQGNPVSYTDPFGLSPVNGLFSNTNFAHSMLGLLSCIPGVVGSAASALDGMVYAIVDKDYSMAALSFMDVLAFGIGKVGSRLVKADKLTNTAQLMINTSNLLSNAASFGMCADAVMATGFDMYNKYYILGQSVDSDTKWEVLSLGMSVLGSVVSAKGMSKSTKELSDLLQKEGFTNALKEEVLGLANGFKRTPDIMPGGSGMGMNLQFFGGTKGNYGMFSGETRPINSKGESYPQIKVEGYGEVPFPDGPYTPNNSRTLRSDFTDVYKKEFKNWWIDQGRPWPEGNVNIHHIKPLSKGGDNSFDNLVPLVQPEQHQPFTNWWRSYP